MGLAAILSVLTVPSSHTLVLHYARASAIRIKSLVAEVISGCRVAEGVFRPSGYTRNLWMRTGAGRFFIEIVVFVLTNGSLEISVKG